jgi:hypothetical protein
VLPPAENGTTMVMGRSGHSAWAALTLPTTAKHKKDALSFDRM